MLSLLGVKPKGALAPSPAPVTAGATTSSSAAGSAAAFARGWLAGIPGGKRFTVGQRKGHGVGNFLADLLAALCADDELKQHAALQLFYGVNDLAARASRSTPLGMNASRWWDFYLEVGVTDSAFPGCGGC